VLSKRLLVMSFLFVSLTPCLLFGESKEFIRLQADMTLLQQQVRDLQKSFDQQGAVLKTLVEQLAEQISILRKSVEEVKSSNQQTQASVGAKIESVNSQFSAVNSSLDLVLDRISKLSQQIAETKAKVEVLDQPQQQAVQGATGPGKAGPPSPEELYNSAYGDFLKGSYDLSRQGFEEYIKNYPDTELSDNAQYWIGESYYVQRKFPEAVKAFDRVLQDYPKGDKVAAASLKKAYSLLESKNTEAGIRELRLLIVKYPGSDSAQLAKDRLNSLGVPVSEKPAPAKRPTRR
jgi:tol-pal system protein YbgF